MAGKGQSLRAAATKRMSSDREQAIRDDVDKVALFAPADAVLAMVEYSDAAEREFALGLLARAWGADCDSPEAREYLATATLVEGLGVLVAAKNPEKGVAWAEALTSGEARRQVLHDSLRTLARTDAPQAIRFLESRVDQTDGPHLAAGVALGWAEVAPLAAFDWGSRLAAGETRAAAQRAATAIWARTDPVAATQAVLRLPEDQQFGALGGIALTLLAKGDSGAVRWASELPPGTVTDRIRDVIRNAGAKPRR